MSASAFTPIQRSLTATSYTLNNLGLEKDQKLTNHRSSNKSLRRKKSVSFSTNVSIIHVDSWKKYNVDVSESGGCTAWDIKKNEEKRLEEEKRKKKEEESCCKIY